MKIRVNIGMLARIDKLAIARQQANRSYINPVINYSSMEDLQLQLQSIQARNDQHPSSDRRGYLIVPKLLSIDEWDAIATVAQAKLCSESR